jgi:hypothetical protein
VKQLLVIALLAPTAALAEAGTQLTAWVASSRPAHEGDTPSPTPTPAAAPVQPAAETKVKNEKKEEPQTITATTTPDQLASLSGLSVNASLDTFLGQGTFFNPALYSYLASSFFISPRYQFTVAKTKLAVSGTGYVVYEYTLPDNPVGRHWAWRDLAFGFSAPALFKESRFSGVSVTPSISATVPITLESWAATTITVIGAGLNFTRTIGNFDFAASLGGSKGVHKSWITSINGTPPPSMLTSLMDPRAQPVAAQPAAVGQFNTTQCRIGDPVACGYFSTNNDWGMSIALSGDWRATENFSISAQYVWRLGWRYPIVPPGPPDQYTPQAVTSNGDPVANTGFARAPDLIITSIAANYQLSDHWGLQLYTYTAMSPRTADDKALRFPFWDFIAGPLNYSSIGVSLAASF